AKGDNHVTVLYKNEFPDIALRVTRPAKPKPGHGKVRFIMHRKMSMNVRGTTREVWKCNDLTIEYTFKFNRDTHEIIHTAELPAGEYTAFQVKWEHKTSSGNFSGGPYEPFPQKFRVIAGQEHELKAFNRQGWLTPHGTGIFWWDGRRLCRVHSKTKKRLNDLELEQEGAKKGRSAGQVRGALNKGNGERKRGRYERAMKEYRKALQKARESGNRILTARAAKGMSWLLATAQDESFRNAPKTLA
ncbi:unnamed protein product, partial [marine sediment metagenome]